MPWRDGGFGHWDDEIGYVMVNCLLALTSQFWLGIYTLRVSIKSHLNETEGLSVARNRKNNVNNRTIKINNLKLTKLWMQVQQ